MKGVTLFLMFVVGALASEVKVDIVSSHPNNPRVNKRTSYSSHVTLSIENDDGTLTPAGWSTRAVRSIFLVLLDDACIQGRIDNRKINPRTTGKRRKWATIYL